MQQMYVDEHPELLFPLALNTAHIRMRIDPILMGASKCSQSCTLSADIVAGTPSASSGHRVKR